KRAFYRSIPMVRLKRPPCPDGSDVPPKKAATDVIQIDSDSEDDGHSNVTLIQIGDDVDAEPEVVRRSARIAAKKTPAAAAAAKGAVAPTRHLWWMHGGYLTIR
ncbi:hypothetical protein PFISCL1PPCAC_25570, partial [Pristionchus fissidentatus]